MSKVEKVEAPEGYTQIGVWPATKMGDKTPEDFQTFIKDELDIEILFLDCIITLPDTNQDGIPVVNTGGRSDILFRVHKDSIPSFTIKRIQWEMKWWEDYVDNNKSIIPPDFIKKYPKT